MQKFTQKKKETIEGSLTKTLKVSEVLLDNKIKNQVSKWIEEKVTAINCISCFSFSQLFKLQQLFKKSLRVIDRWFTTVADSENFLELDFSLVPAIFKQF